MKYAMNTTSVVVRFRRRSQRRRNHWVLLDSAWAKLLGVRKTAGVYQIRSNELQLKLFLMREAPGSSARHQHDGHRPGTPSDKSLPIPTGINRMCGASRPPLMEASDRAVVPV